MPGHHPWDDSLFASRDWKVLVAAVSKSSTALPVWPPAPCPVLRQSASVPASTDLATTGFWARGRQAAVTTCVRGSGYSIRANVLIRDPSAASGQDHRPFDLSSSAEAVGAGWERKLLVATVAVPELDCQLCRQHLLILPPAPPSDALHA